MKLKTLAFLTVSILSTPLWADYSGHYTCDTVHRGKEINPTIDITSSGNAYHATVKWNDQTRETDLIATKDASIFLNHWESENSIGVSSWQFKDANLIHKKMFVDTKDGKQFLEQSVCKKTN